MVFEEICLPGVILLVSLSESSKALASNFAISIQGSTEIFVWLTVWEVILVEPSLKISGDCIVFSNSIEIVGPPPYNWFINNHDLWFKRT